MARWWVLLLLVLLGCPGSTGPDVDAGTDAGVVCELTPCEAPLPTPVRAVPGPVHEHTWLDRTGQPLGTELREGSGIDEVSLAQVLEASRTAIPAHAAAILEGCEALPCVIDELVLTAQALLRRSLTDAERAAVADVVPAMEAAPIEAVLWQLRFLPEVWLVLERGDPEEAASRLAAALWRSAPDETLRALFREDDVEGAVDLALADERSERGWQAFHREVFRVGSFHPELAERLLGETERYLDSLRAADTTYDALLRSPFTFVDDTLAAHYGFEARPGDELSRVDVPPRYNLLTHGAVFGNILSLRGVSVRQELLCSDVPPLPADVSPVIPEEAPGATRRERLENTLADDPRCVSCHELFDPFGFALEAYGQEGEYRPTEGGVPVDTSFSAGVGECIGETPGVAGDGPADLVAWLVASPDAQRCYARQWAGMSLGAFDRPTFEPVDECVLSGVDFRGRTITELLVILARLETAEPARTIPPITFLPVPEGEDPVRIGLQNALLGLDSIEVEAEVQGFVDRFGDLLRELEARLP